MTVVVDINVLLDLLQARLPHYPASAAALNLIATRKVRGFLASHSLTTLYYLTERHGSRSDALAAVDHALRHFEIVALEHSDWLAVRQLPIADFEDAAVALTAAKVRADCILTRNESDFVASAVPAITPAAFLARGVVGP